MRFIHTSDWHLGKTLDGKSRYEEQKKFCEDFIDIVDSNNIDMVIIAGDIYNSYNPTEEALRLFYNTVSKLANNGERCVLVLCGDHDNMNILTSAEDLEKNQGIIIFGSNPSLYKDAKYNRFSIIESKENYLKLGMKGELINIINISKEINNKNDLNYISELEENFTDNDINIAIGHIYVNQGEIAGSERSIKLSNVAVIDKNNLPSKAQYIALGHLHNSQKISQRINAYYSGAPISYSKEEKYTCKGAYIVDIAAGEDINVRQVKFKEYKPIRIFNCKSIEEAIKICNENKEENIWSYFDIKSNRAISSEDIKKMNQILDNIVEVRTSIVDHDYEIDNFNLNEKSIGGIFREFYKFSKKSEPSGELIDLFINIFSE